MKMNTIDRLPAYLKKHCVEQDYDAYTARDHAAWRFIMRQNRAFFRKHAVPIYEKGLEKTGIPIDRIPRISEMDAKLQKFGWGAVAVCGFIPPAAFLEFQAHGVLAIATDMRTVEHIEYTPAPDIVHEAAGHAPIVAHPAYATYLKRYAKVAQKAIFSKEDIDAYEAIRYLSDIKENPDTKPEEIAIAEERFKTMSKKITYVSEAAKVARMAWWTVEYGLVGNIKHPLIYGAGLLSSVGESQNCLSSNVKKIPLRLDCIETSYDITKPQPQLFVAPNLDHLTKVLEELEKTLAFYQGGITGLEKAQISKSVNTIVLDSGLQISGVLEKFETNNKSVDFIKLTGPVQLACNDKELLGHSRRHHPSGFSTPLGHWEKHNLKKLGIIRGHQATLKFKSGFTVSGVVSSMHYDEEKLQIITWKNCTVRRGDTIYFEPAWGDFDMAVGEKIVSVFGGPANRDEFGEYNVGDASTKPGRSSAFTDDEIKIFELHQKLSNLRKSKVQKNIFTKLAVDIQLNHPSQWLLGLETLELAKQKLKLTPEKDPVLKQIYENLLDARKYENPNIMGLIEKGLALLNEKD